MPGTQKSGMTEWERKGYSSSKPSIEKGQYVFQFSAAAIRGIPPNAATILVQEIDPRNVELDRERNRVNARELAQYLGDYLTGETAREIIRELTRRIER